MKMFQVETLLNLLIYVRNVDSKTQKHRFPFIIIFTIVPNDTRIRVILVVPRTISFNCCRDLLKIQSITLVFQCLVMLF